MPINLDKAELLKELVIPTSFGKRLGAYILDYIIFYIGIMLLFGGFFAILQVFLGFDIEAFDAYTETPMGSLLDKLITAFMHCIYYIVFELIVGRTPAKILLKLIVVNEDGFAPTTNQYFQRNFYRLVPFDGFSYLESLPRGWHDSWSNTYVINESEIYKSLLKQSQPEIDAEES